MLRVRGGNNFTFSQDELEAMKTDALLLRAVGRVDGFVFGALTDENVIDVKACQEIIQVTAPLPVTFHRAIDVCNDPLNAIQIIADLGLLDHWDLSSFLDLKVSFNGRPPVLIYVILSGFKRILTSGQMESAMEGIPLIKQMVEKAGNQVSIMVGAGVRKENVAYILEQTNAKEYHGSAKTSTMKFDVSDKPKMGQNNPSSVTDVYEVASTVKAAHSVLSVKK